MSKCEICGKEGFHKMSCPTQKVTVFISDENLEQKDISKMETTESGVSEIPTYQSDIKIGNTDFVCDWCKRVLEVTKDNYFLGAKMYDDGVEENCTCNE